MSDSYKKFYAEYKHKLFSYLLYKSGDHDVAKDITQESFVRHFQHYGRDAVISPALLFTIARNALTDHHRYRRRFQLVETSEPETAVNETGFPEDREQSERIHAALKKLPEKDRELLSLAVGGVPYREIAEIFAISEANVKVRVHRIRVRLRAILQNEV